MTTRTPLTRKLLLWHMQKEIGQLFSSMPSDNSKTKLTKITALMRKKKFDREKLEDYIEFSYKQLSNIKDRFKRSNVNYFIAILANSQNLNHYLDYRKTPSDIDPTSSDNDKAEIIHHNGFEYRPLKEEALYTIHYSFDGKKYRFLIKDYSEDTPRFLRLKKFNEEFPNNRLVYNRLAVMARNMI